MAQTTAQALVAAEAEGRSAATACRGVALSLPAFARRPRRRQSQTESHQAQRRDGTDRCLRRPRVPCLRAGGERGHRARQKIRRKLRRRHQQSSHGRGGVSPGAHRASWHGGPSRLPFRRQRSMLGAASARSTAPIRWRRCTRARMPEPIVVGPVAHRSDARQDHGLCQRRQTDSVGLGSRQRGQPDH